MTSSCGVDRWPSWTSCVREFKNLKTQSAEVRNLVLKGDWPTEFPKSLVYNAFESERKLEDVDRNLVKEAIGDRLKSVELIAFYDKDNSGEQESSEVRYEKLRNWVLPGHGHGIRLDSRQDSKTVRTEEQLAARETWALNCPAWDMITLAKETGKLAELTEAINKLDVPEKKTAPKYRDINALKSLLAIANSDDELAVSHMKEIFGSVVELEAEAKENKSKAGFGNNALYIPAWFAASRPALFGIAESFGKKCKSNFRSKVTARVASFATISADQELTQWNAIPIGAPNGAYLDRWNRVSGGLLTRTPGESQSPLYFQSPLMGKFEITADVSRHNGSQVWLDYGGYRCNPAGERASRTNRCRRCIDSKIQKEGAAVAQCGSLSHRH